MAWGLPLLSTAQAATQSAADTSGGTAPCVEQGALCSWLYDVSGNEQVAEVVAWIVGTPLRIALVVVLALVANRLARRLIHRMAKGVGRATAADSGSLLTSTNARARATERAQALETLLKSVASVAIGVIALLVIVDSLGVDATAIIAGAGVAGLALSIGAQSLVKDMLGGVTILIEDQYGIGDEVDLGLATGRVEKVSLRATTVRDLDGTLWYVPNGQIERVANYSQLWSRVLVDVRIGYEADADEARAIIKQVAEELATDPAFAGEIVEPPGEAIVHDLAPDAVVLRITMRTKRDAVVEVERELRVRVRNALGEAGIAPALPRHEIALLTTPE